MMEEVAISVVLDTEVSKKMSEEEILATLVSETLPKHEVPSKKPKLKEQQSDDPLDIYRRENQKLQETSLRLEQENDDLAHQLVTSKISLRKALDQAEDRADELTKELLKTKYTLLQAEEEKKETVEESAQLKELFRREMDKAETELKRTKSIITDYKQICSKLNTKLERQQSKNEEELDQIKEKVMECQHCRSIFGADGSVRTDGERSAQDLEKDSLRQQIQQLETELAQTKLLMVESRCKIQDLEHQKGELVNQLEAAKSTWLRKRLDSLLTTSSGLQHPGSAWTGIRRLSWTPGKPAPV